MNKLIAIIFTVIALSSCKKEGYVYNHDYKFDKKEDCYSSGAFTVDHILTKEEEKQWCNEMNQKMVDTRNSFGGHYTVNDIDTSFVYYICPLKDFN